MKQYILLGITLLILCSSNTNAFFETPSNTILVTNSLGFNYTNISSNFVPYIGAIQNVNLDGYELTSKKLISKNIIGSTSVNMTGIELYNQDTTGLSAVWSNYFGYYIAQAFPLIYGKDDLGKIGFVKNKLWTSDTRSRDSDFELWNSLDGVPYKTMFIDYLGDMWISGDYYTDGYVYPSQGLYVDTSAGRFADVTEYGIGLATSTIAGTTPYIYLWNQDTNIEYDIVMDIDDNDSFKIIAGTDYTRNDFKMDNKGNIYMDKNVTINEQLRNRDNHYWETDFIGQYAYNTPIWYMAGVSAGTTSSYSTYVNANRVGVQYIRSSTTNNSGAWFLTGTSNFLLSGGERTEFIFRILDTSTNDKMYLGFWDNTAPADVTDASCLYINGATLKGLTASNSARSYTTTNYTLSTSNWYRGIVTINSNASSVLFELYESNEDGSNNDLLWNKTLTTNIPTGSSRVVGHGINAWRTDTTQTYLAIFDYMNLEINRELIR